MMELFARCFGVMIFSKRSFDTVVARPIEWHVILLSLLFGGLFAGRLVSEQNVFFFIIMGLASGVGYIYASGYFLAWLIRLGGTPVSPDAIRMVIGYALTPFILGLLSIVLAERGLLPKMSAVNFTLIVLTWVLHIYGIKVVSRIPWIQALFVSVIPILALMMVIAILFKVAWMLYGY